MSGNRVVELSRGEADLALRSVLVREDGVRVRKVHGMAVGLYAAPEYLRRHGAPATLASIDSLSGHDLLVPGGELGKLPEARLLERVPGARVVLRTNSLPVLVEATVAGHGIAPIVDRWAERAGLVRVLALPHIPLRPIWLALAPGAGERPAVRVVADELARIVAEPS